MFRGAFLFFQLISLVATGLAIRPFTIQQAEVLYGDTLTADLAGSAVALAFTFGIQAGLTIFWLHFHKSPWTRPISLAFALALSTASALPSAATWTAALEIKDVRAHLHNRATAEATRPLADFTAQQSRIAGEAQRLAALAEQKRSREEAFGGTCLGDASGGSCGIRCRLRQRQTGEFAAIASDASALAEDAIDIASEFGPASDEEELRGAFSKAIKLVNGLERASIESRLSEQLRGFREGWLDPQTGAEFECRDPEMERRIDGLLSNLATTLVFPATAPRAVDLDFLRTLEVAAGRIFALAKGAFMPGSAPEEDSADIMLGLLIAVAIELMIIQMIAIDMSNRRRVGTLGDTVEDYLRAPGDVPPEKHDALRKMVCTLHNFSIRANGVEYFAAPLDGDPTEAAYAAQLADLLALRPDRTTGDSLDLAAVDPGWVKARERLHGNARRFRLHVIPKTVSKWRRKMIRDLGIDTA